MDHVMESRRKMLRADACERPRQVATCSGERASRNGRQRYASSQMLRGPCARKRAQSVPGWLMLLSLASCPQLSGAPASVSLRGQRTGSDLGEASGPELVASSCVAPQGPACADGTSLLGLALHPWTAASFLDGEAHTAVDAKAAEGANFSRFEAGPLFVPRADPAHFELLQVDSRIILALVAGSVSLEPGSEGAPMVHGVAKDFQLVKRVKGSDGEWWSGGVPAASLTLAEVRARLGKGFTLIVNSVDCRLPSLARVAEQLEGELGLVVQINAYLTPPNAQGFETHWDPMESLVLQIEGNKTWHIYQPIIPLPRPDQRFKPRAADIDYTSRRLAALKPGSTLYLPRGWLHEATTYAGISNASNPGSINSDASSAKRAASHRHKTAQAARDAAGSHSLHLSVGIDAQHFVYEQVLHAVAAALHRRGRISAQVLPLMHLAVRDASTRFPSLRASLRAPGVSCASLFDELSRPARRAPHSKQPPPQAAAPGGAVAGKAASWMGAEGGLAAAGRSLKALGAETMAPDTRMTAVWQSVFAAAAAAEDDGEGGQGGPAWWAASAAAAAAGEATVGGMLALVGGGHAGRGAGGIGDGKGEMEMQEAAVRVVREGRAVCEEAVAGLWRDAGLTANLIDTDLIHTEPSIVRGEPIRALLALLAPISKSVSLVSVAISLLCWLVTCLVPGAWCLVASDFEKQVRVMKTRDWMTLTDTCTRSRGRVAPAQAATLSAPALFGVTTFPQKDPCRIPCPHKDLKAFNQCRRRCHSSLPVLPLASPDHLRLRILPCHLPWKIGMMTLKSYLHT